MTPRFSPPRALRRAIGHRRAGRRRPPQDARGHGSGAGRCCRGGDRHRPLWRRERTRRRERQRDLADDGEAAVAVPADAGERHARLCGLREHPRAVRDRSRRGSAGRPAALERRSDAGDGGGDAGRGHADARGSPGDAGGGAGEGAGRLRGRGRRRSGLRQPLARERRRLVVCRRELMLQRRADGVRGAAERHRRRRQGGRRSLTGLLGRKTTRERAVEPVHSALVGGALRAEASTFTALPSVGQIITRGQSLYEISGQPVLLLYGWSRRLEHSRQGWRPDRTWPS